MCYELVCDGLSQVTYDACIWGHLRILQSGKESKSFSLCIKLRTYKCKSFVCTKLETMDYHKKECGGEPVKELLLLWKGKQLKVEYKHMLLLMWSEYWSCF